MSGSRQTAMAQSAKIQPYAGKEEEVLVMHAATGDNPHPDVFLELQAEIKRREETIRTLKAGGHRTVDAERELKNLKETAALIK